MIMNMNVMNVKEGAVLYCNYGAMYPDYVRVVREISEDLRFAYVAGFENEEIETYIDLSTVRPYGTRTVNGSPIGVFVLPENHPYNSLAVA